MPRDFPLHRTPFDVLNYEIVQEQAAALGRMGRALESMRVQRGHATQPASTARCGTSLKPD